MTPRNLARLARLSSALPVLCAAGAAFAQDAASAAETQAPADPHAWALWTSCSVFFGAVILFLVATHRRAAASVDKLSAIERRLDEAERRR